MKLARIVLVLALAALGACGDPGSDEPGPGAGGAETQPPESPEPGSPPPGEDLFSGVAYGCGQGVFTAEDVEAARPPSDDILQAIEDLRESPDGGVIPAEGWIVVSESEDRTMVLAPQRDRFSSAAFDREDGVWEPAGWGDCTPSLYVDGRSVLRWAFTEDAYPPEPDATTLSVQAVEVTCSSGRDITGKVEAEVVYGEDRIAVVLTAPGLDPNTGYDCQGTPPVPYEVVLREPVGDREVVDPSVYPAEDPGTRLR